MRERAQASVETAALTAVALALAIVLGLGVVRLGPALASTIAGAVSGAVASGTPTAPGLDGLERELLAAATGAGDSAPTLLDLRTHLLARLGDEAGAAAFDGAIRPVVEQALGAASISSLSGAAVHLVERVSEDAWLEAHFHTDISEQVDSTILGLAPGYSLLEHAGVFSDDVIAPGHEAGDIVIEPRGGLQTIVLRRQPGEGLVIVERTATRGGHGAAGAQ